MESPHIAVPVTGYPVAHTMPKPEGSNVVRRTSMDCCLSCAAM